MYQDQKDELVFRILSGELIIPISGKLYKLVPPDPRTRYMASCVYKATINHNKFDNWLTDQDCIMILVKNDLCSIDIDSNLKTIVERIDELKIELFGHLFSQNKQEATRNVLMNVKDKYVEMLMVRHMFDHLTLEGFAEMARQEFLIYSTLCDMDDEIIWPTIDDVDPVVLHEVMSYVKEHVIAVEVMRELARTDPWRSYWNVKKGNPFSRPIDCLTEDQRTLIALTRMYDSAYEHPNCPSENVIEDDDMFDGWMLKERNAREQERTTTMLDNRFGKSSDHREVFLPAKNRAEAEKINNLNDFSSKMVKAQRQSTINKLGKATDDKFQDVRLDLQQQANELIKQRK